MGVMGSGGVYEQAMCLGNAHDFALARAAIDGKNFVCHEHFVRLTDELGWTDLWRASNGAETEYTWYSKRKGGTDRNGFRVDHAFASPALRRRVVSCQYSHEERSAGVSDHSILLVEIAGPQEFGQVQ